jgi:SAM-dependent methyltransferase
MARRGPVLQCWSVSTPTSASPSPEPRRSGSGGKFDDQRRHWASTFAANPDMYGTGASDPGAAAADRFARDGARRVLELGAGQGRDTLLFAARGFDVVAGDFADTALEAISRKGATAGLADHLRVVRHDVRTPLPFAANVFDASYSHMLFCMALSSTELDHLAAELLRVLRPGGLVVYTVRHKGDAHYGAGIPHGDDMFENGGFVVHFFDRDLVDRLAGAGFDLDGITEFTEGALPRRLWRVTMHKRKTR